MTNIILINIICVILINVVKGSTNKMFTQSYGLSLFYFPDKEYVLNLANQIDITNELNSFTFMNKYQYNCEINSQTYKLNEKGTNNSFSFQATCNDSIPIFVYYDLTNISQVSISITNTLNRELKTFTSLQVKEHLYLLQLFLHSSLIAFLIVCCGLYISFYGYCHVARSTSIIIMFILYTLVEEIYEKTDYISETKELGVFVFIFTIIICGALSILIYLKGTKFYPFFYGFTFIYTITKFFIYLIPISYYSYSFYYLYTGISILLSFTIGGAACLITKKYLCYVYLITSSFIGSYFTICGLSYLVGGLLYAKVKIDYYYNDDVKLKDDKNMLYLIIYSIQIVITILFQLFQLLFDYKTLNKEKFHPTFNLIGPVDSDEDESNSLGPSNLISENKSLI